MRGRQVLIECLRAHGVEWVFGNPGTTENPVLEALAAVERPRYVLALHEAVALGAAAYYAHASGRTGVVNLHVAPGLGNALGMLYNAAEANAPLVVTAGQQDTRMRLREPLLGGDLVAMAAPLVKWSAQVERADELALALHRAFKIAHDPPAGPVFLALPIDVLEQETGEGPLPPGVLYRESAPDPAGVEHAAGLLLGARSPVIVAGDGVARAAAQAELLALAERLGAPVWHETLHQHLLVSTAHPACRLRLPADLAGIRKALEGADVLLLVGGSFFEEVWYDPGSPFPPETAVIQVEAAPARLAHTWPVRVGLVASPRAALRALRQAVEAGAGPAFAEAARQRLEALATAHGTERAGQRARAERRWDQEPIAAPRLMAELGAALPPEALVVDESVTAAADLARSLALEAGAYYGTRGGGIGQALPGALGVKLARPGRPVVAISGDGSALYSIQALWTAAHHDLATVFVIIHNRQYRVLKHNLDQYRRRFGVPAGGYPQMDLVAPDLDFVALARGFGVEARAVRKPAELGAALGAALGAGRPWLLDVFVEGK